MAERSCLVALCHNWPVVFTTTTRSVMELGWGDRVARAKAAHGFSAIDHAWFTGSPRIDVLRDAAVVSAQRAGYTHLLFLDADMAWPSDLLLRLLAHHDQGIVSGLYFQKGPPYHPIALRDGEPQDGVMWYLHDQGYRETGTDLRAEDVVGMGCTLIPMAVFEAIGKRPWFAYEDDAEGWPKVSEDVPLCRRAKAAGFGVWLDPTIKCLHTHVDTIDERHFLRYRQSVNESVKPSVTLRRKDAAEVA